jgi:hypothetical protein
MSPKPPTCLDCYFHRHALCALKLEQTCPTFRAAGRTLQPPQHPPLVARPVPVHLTAGVAVAAAY